MLSREQFYLDFIFKIYPTVIMNNCSTAGTTLGLKHKPEFIFSRLGSNNPMSGKHFHLNSYICKHGIKQV
jgi:hypothetical protein